MIFLEWALLTYTFTSNHNVPQSSCGICLLFGCQALFIERFHSKLVGIVGIGLSQLLLSMMI